MVHPHLHFDFIPVVAFKYILCYGSSSGGTPLKEQRRDLNTSYVMVHRPEAKSVQSNALFKYILCYGSSGCPTTLKNNQITFKYILCYGSSPIEYAFNGQV